MSTGSVAITHGIRIAVTPAFLPEQSAPEAGKYVWSYRIRITNESDRTARLLESSLKPAVDRAAGGTVTREAVRLAVGPSQYETIRESVASEAALYTMTPLTDPEFNRRQGERVEELLSGRMREMSYPDFVELLRSAIREDEWLLYLHGAVLGFGAGLVHLAIFGV